MSEVEHIAAAVQFLVRSLVDHPEELFVSVAVGEGEASMINVMSSPKNFGRVIGMQDRTARALRTILVAVSGKLNSQTCHVSQAPTYGSHSLYALSETKQETDAHPR